MLVKPRELFAKAFNMQYALGAFNTSNLELTQAIIWAAQKQRAPVIVQTSEGAIEYTGQKQIAAIISSLAGEANVPVVMHLDHGHSMAVVKNCIEAGYTSVMIDASTKPIDENIALTGEVVEYAHAHGVWVEAELGTILGAEGIKTLQGEAPSDELLTNPAQTKKFVEATGVDCLAVAVGTIHGAFSGREYIRFELVEEIAKQLPALPLVIHGASGLASEHLQRVAHTNVCKVNVDTELRLAFERAVKSYFGQEHDKCDPRKILGPARDAVQRVVEEKIRLFGSDGKAA
ncbi:MAG: class II fructose-bisphosphate aldolase [Candidatus Andersenbacteria bacterium]|nr:class II fructose-bisphosphate aldolase [bacterium]MDZ4225613.1 class II fructose-bisphosphate aldolase [Candidatus Andersenbacteria bacterium]